MKKFFEEPALEVISFEMIEDITTGSDHVWVPNISSGYDEWE